VRADETDPGEEKSHISRKQAQLADTGARSLAPEQTVHRRRGAITPHRRAVVTHVTVWGNP